MRKIVFSAMVSLDGYIEDKNGEIGWSRPDEELHRFANAKSEATSAFLMGRGLYEAMVPFWPNVAKNPTGCDFVDEFARIYDERPRYVFSRTLEVVDAGSTLVRGDIATEVMKLKDESGEYMDLGGPGIAGTFAKLGLIDQLCLMTLPVILGGGKPFFGSEFSNLQLKLIENRTFESGAVALTYERV